ncbi:MAG: hypothetical protein IID48_17600 [Proteobacteria bacterium]|nr:hypothetical protein [Pseudomonadota bacterium]
MDLDRDGLSVARGDDPEGVTEPAMRALVRVFAQDCRGLVDEDFVSESDSDIPVFGSGLDIKNPNALCVDGDDVSRGVCASERDTYDIPRDNGIALIDKSVRVRGVNQVALWEREVTPLTRAGDFVSCG